MTEQVLVIDSSLLNGFKNKDSINTNDNDIEFLIEECLPLAFFIDREEAEKNNKYKQIIPYVVIQRDNKILSYTRTKVSGESRLHDKSSIGFGGHINPIDQTNSGEPFDIFANALHRELNEELNWEVSDDQYESKIIGLINDNSNPVGEVHLGVLVLAEAISEPTFKEDSTKELQWLALEDFALFKYENWSQLVIKYLKEKK